MFKSIVLVKGEAEVTDNIKKTDIHSSLKQID